MKKLFILGSVALTVFATGAQAQVIGNSSNEKVKTGASDAIPFGSGEAGLSLEGSFSINLQNGPVDHIKEKYNNQAINTTATENVDGLLNPKYLMVSDVNPVLGIFDNANLGQVWYENRANNTEIISVRQIANPIIPAAPKFGGLVIGKVPNLPADTKVFFGEWAPRANNAAVASNTDLNLDHADRTVWFVGENPTGSTQNLAQSTYTVVGVNKHVPGQNDFYTGTLTATFQADIPRLTGSLVRGTDIVSFNDVRIDNTDGTFQTLGTTDDVHGRFYGANAAALAGYSQRGTPSTGDDVAFGGSKN